MKTMHSDSVATPSKDYVSRRRTITAQGSKTVPTEHAEVSNEKAIINHKKTRANQISRLIETKKLKRSDNSSSFQDLGQHGMLLAAGAGTPDTQNLEK